MNIPAIVSITAGSLIVWAILCFAVFGDSRQKCELVASVETCQWELR